MQFSTILFTTFFAAFAAASPIAAEVNSLEQLQARSENLVERQTWCGDCENGKQIFCSALACYAPTPC